MLQGTLNTRDQLQGELTGGVFYGTTDYTELINKPQINGVTLTGNKSLDDLGIDIPTATSDLTNDSGFITSADVPTKTSDLTNDSGYLTSSDVAAVAISGDYDDLTDKPTIPTAVSQLTNDMGYVQSGVLATVATTGNYSDLLYRPNIPTKTSDLNNDSGFITSADIPTDVSAFNNDAGYITSADIPTDLSDFNNDCDFIGFTEVSGTLTAGNTSITLSDAAILTTSTIEIFADTFGIQPTNAVIATGSITLTFLAQASDLSVKVRVS